MWTANKMGVNTIFRRSGQTVNADEQLNLATTDMEESISAASSVANMRAFDMRPTAQLSLASSHISLEDRTKLEEERERLYHLLDSKVRYIFFSVMRL